MDGSIPPIPTRFQFLYRDNRIFNFFSQYCCFLNVVKLHNGVFNGFAAGVSCWKCVAGGGSVINE
jgi:hypothetical protein